MATALQRLVEVEARLMIATHSCWRLYGRLTGCGNTHVALCCLPTMSVLAAGALGRSQLQLKLRWAQPEVLGYSIEVIAVEVETRLQIATHSCW